MLYHLKCEQNFLTNTNLSKEFTLDVVSGNKDADHNQNNLLHICLFTDIALWKTNTILFNAGTIAFKLLNYQGASGRYSTHDKLSIYSNEKLSSQELKILNCDGLWKNKKISD